MVKHLLGLDRTKGEGEGCIVYPHSSHKKKIERKICILTILFCNLKFILSTKCIKRNEE